MMKFGKTVLSTELVVNILIMPINFIDKGEKTKVPGKVTRLEAARILLPLV